MITKLLTKIFGSKNDRILASLSKTVTTINLLEEEMRGLDDRELGGKTEIFRQRLSHGETLDDLLPEAFAVVREASQRVFGLRHFDVQLVGGIVLHRGNIAEMRTGEGKTLTATLPAYLNALTGHGVHIVTVNDYLARRDTENNRSLFEFLGLSVGTNTAELSTEAKRLAYSADVTYGTNNEFGFDYLRDNMAFDPEQRVQRSLRYAIVDEVDSILIDEARTPLIISGPAEDSSPLYIKINQLIHQLQRQDQEESEDYSGDGHYHVDYKTKQAHLTEKGHLFVEELLIKHGLIQESESLYSTANITLLNHVNVALRAHALFNRNVDYMVRDGEVLIVDEHTGRTMPGRRWSDGLHQAIEAKEGVLIQNENQTLASITLQNYFRMYHKLSGMTGTADTESFEFRHIYNLDTIVIPTNRPMIRQDFSDSVYLTEKDKFYAIIEEIKGCVADGRPVLVGTVSIERSEQLSGDLEQTGISHQVLNAKFHAREAEIIAQAGRPGSVTIATNMAGRGTDIILGGNWQAEIDAMDSPSEEQIATIKREWQLRHEQVVASGGLHIIGSERHESRRIDNQLRGRSGRQGDPGSSRFYLSMDDTLMRIFASERVIKMMRGLGMKPGEVIEHPWVNKAIARAQKKVENYHFDIRKQLLEFDDVANAQRQAVYTQRNILLDAADITEDIIRLREQVVEQLSERYFPPQSMEEEWDVSGLERVLREDFALEIPIGRWLMQQQDSSVETIKEHLVEQMRSLYEEQERIVGSEVMRGFEKNIVLKNLDSHWKEHLAAMDNLRQGVHLCGYAQKDPKQEYKRRSFEMFEEMRSAFEYSAISSLTRMQRQIPEAIEVVRREYLERAEINYLYSQPDENGQSSSSAGDQPGGVDLLDGIEGKISRNSLCPCGSGKKYKQCHGRL